jgi:hypothetical protein
MAVGKLHGKVATAHLKHSWLLRSPIVRVRPAAMLAVRFG